MNPDTQIKLTNLYDLKKKMRFKLDQAVLRVVHYEESLFSIKAQIDYYEDLRAREDFANSRRQSGSWIEAQLDQWIKKLR